MIFAFNNRDFPILSIGGWKVTDDKTGANASIIHSNDKSFEFQWRKLNFTHELVLQKLMLDSALITFLPAVIKYLAKAIYGWESWL